MRDALELVLLLTVLLAGHNVVTGSPRPVKDTMVALAYWGAFLGGVIVLMLMPRVLALAVRFVVPGALACLAVRLLLYGFRQTATTPHLPLPSRGRLARLHRRLGCTLADVAAAMAAAQERRAVEAEAAVQAVAQNVAREDAGAFLPRTATATREAADALAAELRAMPPRGTAADQRFLDGLVLRYGAEAVRKQLRALRPLAAELGNRGLRHHLAHELSVRPVPRERAEALRQLGILVDSAAPSAVSAWIHLQGARFVPAVVVPAYAFVLLRQRRRALLFSICYLLLIGGGTALLLTGKTAGWVFLAGAAQLHLSALCHLSPPGEAGSAAGG